MSLKDILVLVDGTARAAVRIDIAVGLAQRFGARLVGLFGQIEKSSPSIVARRASDGYLETMAKAEALFRAKTGEAGIAAEWKAVKFGEHNFLIRETIICARFTDIVVMGQHDPAETEPSVPEEMAEQLLLHCGRPVLLIPYAGHFATVGKRVLLAWNASREASRAIHDALPLMKDADEVRALAVHPAKEPGDDADLPHVNLADHLACHGITLRIDRLGVDDIGVMDLILSRAADESADLIVMGAHGHIGFPYLHRGAGTRHILRHMTAPVLLSH